MKQKVILLTGANRGIGLALAKKLYQANYFLSIGIRNPSDMNSQIAQWDSTRTLCRTVDVKNNKTMKDWVDATIKKFQTIDMVINCAGILKKTSLEEYDEKILDEILTVNTKAPIYLVSLAWPYLKKSGEGRVINLCSLSAKRVKGESFAYAMSKSALLSFTHSIRQAGWKHGIRATAICPGWVNTDMIRELCPLDLEEITHPDDVADLIMGIISMPNRVSVPELLINCQLEDTV